MATCTMVTYFSTVADYTAVGCKPDLELEEEEEVWYMASEETSPNKQASNSTKTNTTVPASPMDSPVKLMLSNKPTAESAVRLDLQSIAHQQPKFPASTQGPVQMHKPTRFPLTPEKLERRSIRTQKVYAENKLESEQLLQMLVECKYKGNGCAWRGELARQSQHVSICQYNPSGSEFVCT